MKSSPISKIVLEGREYLVKRDDLFDPYLSGNKYRKLHTLLFAPKEKYTKIISYGGTQSNAMLAMAALCKQKGWVFQYYTKALSDTQRKLQEGNFTIALELGMQHHEVSHEFYKDFVAGLRLNLSEDVVVVDQGGADLMALEGLEVLAKEIRESKLDFDAVATPSGTGTTALFLAKALPEHKVYTTPCIGNASYLQEQMQSLSQIPSNLIILEPKKKYHFAKPYKEFYAMYKKLLQVGIEFDLLYSPAMWLALQEQTKEKVLYIHSGGVSGNKSMLLRYEKRGFAPSL
jgi:1-aminocyclopropane-1-carboxylate deaminase/D-cysteine desulfhydrase-like pyridoxal-dependent ACC family enzyme